MKAPVSFHERLFKHQRKNVMKRMSKEWKKAISGKLKKRTRKARCKHVMAVLNNKLETLDTVREEHWPPVGDFDPDEGYSFIVVQWPGQPKDKYPYIHIPAQTCIFLKD